MSDRLTIVFMPESAYGPTNNCIGIGKVLERRGHRVVFAAEASWKGQLEPLGFEEDLVDLAPPAPGDEAAEQDAGQFWIDFITETAPEFRKPTIEQLSTFIEPVWSVVDRRRDVLPAAARGDPRAGAPRRDRRGQRERVPGAAHPRRAVGPDHELQPARDEGPRAAADVQRVPDRTTASGWDAFRAEYERIHRSTWERVQRVRRRARARRRCRTSSSSTSPTS